LIIHHSEAKDCRFIKADHKEKVITVTEMDVYVVHGKVYMKLDRKVKTKKKESSDPYSSDAAIRGEGWVPLPIMESTFTGGSEFELRRSNYQMHEILECSLPSRLSSICTGRGCPFGCFVVFGGNQKRHLLVGAQER
jgi:hypothetical protein